jgi:hypothetical protein
MPANYNTCKNCKKKTPAGAKKHYNLFIGLLLAILPKCPFCVMAYSSTIMLCGKDSLIVNQQNHNSVLSITLTSVFCALIIAGIFLNYRGIRTKYALALSAIGILMIINSVVKSGGQELYYFGITIVFIGVWLNGSLLSFLRKLKNAFGSNKKTAMENPYS